MNEDSRRSRSQARVRHDRNRRILLTLALVVVVACAAVGGTVAWLTATTTPVTNTFTVGNIDITLAETKNDFKMVPGSTIAKDPKVTVKAGSEDCWLFVKAEEFANLKAFITYTMADGWTALPNVTGVCYREVPAAATDTVIEVLANNQVTVNTTVTKAMMDEITTGTATNPTLTFTAYAVQKANVATVTDAWAKLNP